jgi:hypothetical protein
MKNLFFGILTLGSLSAQASMLAVNGPLDATLFEAQVNEEKTHYETLGDLFKRGTLPNLAKISNIAWAGRCFDKKDQNDPTNAGYVFRPKRSDAGPIASNSKAYEAFSYWNLSEAPNFFDKMDIEEALASVPDVPAKNVRLKTNSIEIDVKAPAKSNLKVSGDFLIEEISGPDGDVGPIGKTTVGVRCYYFIPDLNN